VSLATIDANLRLVKVFFHWLACQNGFRKIVTYADADYFTNNRKDARAAQDQRPVQYPSTKAAHHAFQAMPDGTDIERRNKAVFALAMLSCARARALSSLRLKHINLVDGYVYQGTVWRL